MTVTTEITIPRMIRLDLKVQTVVRRAAVATATAMRKQLRAGTDGEGKAIPKPKAERRFVSARKSGRSRWKTKQYKGLRRTGDLIRSVKAAKTKRGSEETTVGPTGKNRRGVSNRRVAAILAHKKDIAMVGPQPAAATEAARKEIARQLKRSRTGGVKYQPERIVTRSGRSRR